MQAGSDITQLGEGSVELSSTYPISYRIVVKKTLPFLLFFVIVLTLVLFLTLGEEPPVEEETTSFFHEGAFAFLAAAFLLFVGKLLYETLYRAHYHYGIEAGHLVISKGIILKMRGSFPLSRITDVYLDRSLSDFFFGLYNLHVSTPTTHSGRFARIDGLSIRTAVKLQKRLSAFLESTEPHPDLLLNSSETVKVSNTSV